MIYFLFSSSLPRSHFRSVNWNTENFTYIDFAMTKKITTLHSFWSFKSLKKLVLFKRVPLKTRSLNIYKDMLFLYHLVMTEFINKVVGKMPPENYFHSIYFFFDYKWQFLYSIFFYYIFFLCMYFWFSAIAYS